MPYKSRVTVCYLFATKVHGLIFCFAEQQQNHFFHYSTFSSALLVLSTNTQVYDAFINAYLQPLVSYAVFGSRCFFLSRKETQISMQRALAKLISTKEKHSSVQGTLSLGSEII